MTTFVAVRWEATSTGRLQTERERLRVLMTVCRQ